MKAYAIADTDGGRHEPVPLVRYIYSSLNEAYQARSFIGFDAHHYPVIEVEVNVQPTGNGNDAALTATIVRGGEMRHKCYKHKERFINDCPWVEIECHPMEYEQSMESGIRECKDCGAISVFTRERRDKKSISAV